MTDPAPNSIFQYRNFIWIERREHKAIAHRHANNRQCPVQEQRFSLEWTDKQLIAFAITLDGAGNAWARYEHAIRVEGSFRRLEA